ncbi:hypothetical protein AD998_09045 [bacterium 336/3]|nr:hypothetical protein AD998_09045 [bacterium 336/3]
METLIIKREKWQTITLVITLSSIACFFLFIMFVIISAFFKGDAPLIATIFVLLFFGGCTFLFLGLIIGHFRLSPTIIIHKDEIKIGKKIYKLTDIDKVHFFAKIKYQYVRYTEKNHADGIKIRFKNSKEDISIIEPMYSDIWKLKLFLEQVFVLKKDFQMIEFEKKSFQSLKLKDVKKYKGDFSFFTFFTILTIFLIGILGGLVFLSVLAWKSQSIIGFSITSILSLVCIYGYFSIQNYILLTPDYLIVCNHIFPWKKIVYELSNLKKVNYDGMNTLDSITIVKNNYQTHRHFIVSFEQTEFKKDLAEKMSESNQ